MLQIFAIDLKTKERFEITDLYWFEEEAVHDFGGEAHYAKYAFEVFVRGVMVFPPVTQTITPTSSRSKNV